MDGSLPGPWSAVNSRYQQAACCVEYHLAVTIVTDIVTMQSAESSQHWLNKFEQKIIKVFSPVCGGKFSSRFELQAVRSRVPFPVVSLEFLIYKILSASVRPSGRHRHGRKRVQKYLLDVKSAGALYWQLIHLRLPTVFNSNYWNLTGL
jgi:hypothetical protein